MTDWPEWVDTIDVFRDGPGGRFCCTAHVDDDWVWRFRGEVAYVFIGWGDTITDAITAAFEAGNARVMKEATP